MFLMWILSQDRWCDAMTNNTQVEELADEKCSDLKDDYTITRQTDREREKQREILMNTGTCFHLCHYVEQT